MGWGAESQKIYNISLATVPQVGVYFSFYSIYMC